MSNADSNSASCAHAQTPDESIAFNELERQALRELGVLLQIDLSYDRRGYLEGHRVIEYRVAALRLKKIEREMGPDAVNSFLGRINATYQAGDSPLPEGWRRAPRFSQKRLQRDCKELQAQYESNLRA